MSGYVGLTDVPRGWAMNHTRVTRGLVGLGALVTALFGMTAVGPSAGAVTFVPGSPGLGDPFFPSAGNGGYDVSHYDLVLAYEPSSNQLSGTATITATATVDLSRFDLDLRGFTIARLLVNGQAASFTRDGVQELVITPAA